LAPVFYQQFTPDLIMTQLETEALEVLHLMEDMVEYHCDENQLSGEKVWLMIRALADFKCEEFPQ